MLRATGILVCFAATIATGPSWAAAPTGRYARSSQGGEAFVLDIETSLTWQDRVDYSLALADAKSHCATMIYAGKTGWRLPTYEELLSLVDWNDPGIGLDTHVFLDAPSGVYWSSTILVDDSDSVWVHPFMVGVPDYDGYILVRCVK